MIMTKIWNILPLAAVMVAFFACTERNTPIDNTGTETGEQTGETDTIGDKVEEQNWSDTIRIVWNGAAATVTGENDSLSITNSNGYVAITSSVTGTQIVYLLSGNGTGQLTIYGSYRHNITLDDLTLTCSDGPEMRNFKQAFAALREGTGLLRLESDSELAADIILLTENTELRNTLGNNAAKAIAVHAGALNKTITILEDILS